MKPGDPVSEGAERAIAHLNGDHADALLEMARQLGGCPGARTARCVDADRSGLDLVASTAEGPVEVRVPYAAPIDGPEGLRAATVELAKRARRARAEGETR